MNARRHAILMQFLLHKPTIHWKDWCWSSSILATWYEEPTYWKRAWCWKRLRAGGEGGNRGWEGWMASLTQWTWVLSKLWEMVKNREAWRAAVHGAPESQTRFSDRTTTNWQNSPWITIIPRHFMGEVFLISVIAETDNYILKILKTYVIASTNSYMTWLIDLTWLMFPW